MSATESMLIKRMSNLLFVSIALAASAGYVYRAEIFDMVYDSLASNEAAIKRKWLPENGGRFMLRPERNDVSFLRIGALRTGAPNSLGVPVSFELTNLGDANDFPNIAVFLVGADGKPVRHLVFSPSEYSHDSQFKQQHVELLVQPRPDEQRFTVQVFYGVRP